MALLLPPKLLINYDDSTAAYVGEQLTSVIAGHVMAAEVYTFYEEVDRWLGPWGEQGYPIGYGKFYAMAFNSSRRLQEDAEARQWVEKTTRLLQSALRDYIVQRMRDRTLGKITEAEFRDAAFKSHAKAYTEGGLSRVAAIAPELIPVIMSIPAKEFDPRSSSFGATVRQVFETAGMVLPNLPGYYIGALLPAHSGLFQIAARRDEQARAADMRRMRAFEELTRILEDGRIDDVPVLDAFIRQLRNTDFDDQNWAAAARRLMLLAETRKQKLLRYYRMLPPAAPEIQARIASYLKQF